MKNNNFINKIVLASFGTEVSENTLKYAIYIAKAFDSTIQLIYIKPTTYNRNKADCFTKTEKLLNEEWNEYTYNENINKIKFLQKKIRDEDINSSNKIIEGVPCYEILNYADKKSGDLVVINKGMELGDVRMVQKTTLYVINNSKIPVLSINHSAEFNGIKNVLVPVDINNIYSEGFNFAMKFSEAFNNCSITLLNIQNKYEAFLPAEVVERKHGDAYFKLSKSDIKNINIHSVVLDSENISDGIAEYADSNNIDLIILQTYAGQKQKIFHSYGSVAEQVLKQTNCPIITINADID